MYLCGTVLLAQGKQMLHWDTRKKHGFLQNSRHNSYQTYSITVNNCEQPTAKKLQLPTQAYNSSMVRLHLVPRTYGLGT